MTSVHIFWWLASVGCTVGALACPEGWPRAIFVLLLFVSASSYGWHLALRSRNTSKDVQISSSTFQLVPFSQKDSPPSAQTKCPCCGASFEEADVREPADHPDKLDFHCPECAYRFARWPKNMC